MRGGSSIGGSCIREWEAGGGRSANKVSGHLRDFEAGEQRGRMPVYWHARDTEPQLSGRSPTSAGWSDWDGDTMTNMRRGGFKTKKGARKCRSRQGGARTHRHSTKGSRRYCASSSCRGSCVVVEFGLEVYHDPGVHHPVGRCERPIPGRREDESRWPRPAARTRRRWAENVQHGCRNLVRQMTNPADGGTRVASAAFSLEQGSEREQGEEGNNVGCVNIQMRA